MGIMERVGRAVQSLLNELAEEAARETNVIKRQRNFTAQTLAQTFVLGFLANPEASDENLAGTAAMCGVQVTPQGVGNRFSDELVAFLEALFRRAVQKVISSDTKLAALLERFPAVPILDSTTITLPAELAERFPGCGGSHGSGQAAMKLQVQVDLRTGALHAINIEAGRDCDYKTELQSVPLPAGALRIADLGYFDTAVFEDFGKQGVYWLSRLQYGTNVYTAEGELLELMSWLKTQPQGFVERPIQLGSERRVACRLIAWRMPEEVANRRRQKLIADAKSKSGRMPSRERLEWCDWTILVTTVPVEKLAPGEAAVLYRARWQVELLFKRWKSLGLIAELSGATVARKMVRLWARLLAVVVQHWILLIRIWGDSRLSLFKASATLRAHVSLIASSLRDLDRMLESLNTICNSLAASSPCSRRKRPNALELLQDPSELEWEIP